MFVFLISLIYANKVNAIEVCTGAELCSNSYELNCKSENDGFCPEDYGDWSTCQKIDTGGKCYPCDPDCKYNKDGLRDPNGESICSPMTLIIDNPVNPKAKINIVSSIINPYLPNELKIFRGNLPDETKTCTGDYGSYGISCLLSKKSFTSTDLSVAPRQNVYLIPNEIKEFEASGASSYKWSIQSGKDVCEITSTSTNTTKIELKTLKEGKCVLRSTNSLNNLHYIEADITVSKCNSDSDCDDKNSCTLDKCNNPKTLSSYGTIGAYCSNTNLNANAQCITLSGAYGVCNADATSKCATPICKSNLDCNDGNACTSDTCNNAGFYNAACSISSTITTCSNNDQCCPGSAYGCNANNDNSCIAVCGNGVIEIGETCSTCTQDVSSTEVCDNIDNDCDGFVDENVCQTLTYYCDKDGDTYRGDFNNAYGSCGTLNCVPSGCSTSYGSDCRDDNFNINPGKTEICDGIDNNCNGLIDENLKNTYYYDGDGDGYGRASISTQACSAPSSYVSNSLDCNDNNFNVNPGRNEVCNGIDDDCSGGLPSSEYNLDNDGYMVCQNDCNDNNNAVNPGAADNACDGIDNNCNAAYDEQTTDSRTSISGIQRDVSCSNSNSYGTCTGTAYQTCAQASGQTWGSSQACTAGTPSAYGCG